MVEQHEPAKLRRAALQMPRSKAEEKIRGQIEKGKELLNQAIKDEAGLKNVHHLMSRWSNYNRELLKRIIDTDEFIEAYRSSNFRPLVVFSDSSSFQENIDNFQSELKKLYPSTRIYFRSS